MQVFTRLLAVIPRRELSPRRSWLRVRQRMASLMLQVLSMLLQRLGTALLGPRPVQDTPGPGLPAYIEVREAPPAPGAAPAPEPEVKAEAEPEPEPRTVTPPLDLSSIKLVLDRIRRNNRGADLEQILGSLGQLLPLLHSADIPAHKLAGLEQSLGQMRAATSDGASAAGFEVNMAWLLLEREVRSVARHLG